ncbi:MAG TPA: SPOR domain-containing protein [Blastocatellia bacterium]
MTNKQAITVFVFGVGFMLAAFWFGMTVAKNSVSSAANSPSPAVGPANSVQRKAVNAPAQSRAVTNSDSAGVSRYIVRVAAFGTQNDADKFAMDLRRKYLSAHTQPPTSNDDSLYRVDIGPYEKRDEADAVARELGVEGHKGVIILPASKP